MNNNTIVLLWTGDKVENIKKDFESPKFLESNKGFLLLVICLPELQVWQNLLMSGWTIINIDTKNNKRFRY